MRIKLLLPLLLLFGLIAVAGCQQKQVPPPTQQPPTQQKPLKVGEPTVVAKGKTPEDHVREYFDAYKAKNFDAAYDLQPALNKAKQTKEEFSSLRSGFPISDYKVMPVRQQGSDQIIDVEYNLGQNGVWVSSWLFKKKGGNWTAEQYQVQQKQ